MLNYLCKLQIHKTQPTQIYEDAVFRDIARVCHLVAPGKTVEVNADQYSYVLKIGTLCMGLKRQIILS